VFCSGVPMCGANPSLRRISTPVEYVVVSVGPYRLHTRSTPVSAKMRSTRLSLSGSPARFTVRTPGGSPPPSSSARMAEGTVLISVKSTGDWSSATASSTRHTVAPRVSGGKSSKTDRSKLSDVEKSVRSRSSPKAAPAQSRRLTVLRWATATPFGRPVEPEV
jgi:hypothetical protein